MSQSAHKILVIDNHDSFTYNLVQLIEEVSDQEVTVQKNDQLNWIDIEQYDIIFISPGPGLPNEAGELMSFLDKFALKKRIFGVCLGLQAIFEHFGGSLKNLEKVFHGYECEVEQAGSNSKLFRNIDQKFKAGRYHSWVADEKELPESLRVNCYSQSGHIMGIEHVHYPIYAVQFHPESIMTPMGHQMIDNFLRLT